MQEMEIHDIARARLAARSGGARQVRLLANLSQREVAGHCGCSAASVSMWETGKTVPTGPAGRRYCELIISLGDLFAVDIVPTQYTETCLRCWNVHSGLYALPSPRPQPSVARWSSGSSSGP